MSFEFYKISQLVGGICNKFGFKEIFGTLKESNSGRNHGRTPTIFPSE
jgi:hypothetical protein